MQQDKGIMNMVGVVYLTYRRQLQSNLSDYNVSLQQYRILKILARKEYMNPSEIADMLFCDRPTASVIIKNLDKKNWIKKERDIENGKQVKIRITGSGLNKFREIENIIELQSDVEKYFSGKEQAQLKKLLLKLHNGIRDSRL